MNGNSLVFLDQTVPTFFGDQQYLSTFARKLWAKKVYRIGQLVALTEAEVLERAPRTKPTVLKKVKTRLDDVGLRLGMEVKGWNNPDRPCRKSRRAAACEIAPMKLSSR